jgi:hypothetical protein
MRVIACKAPGTGVRIVVRTIQTGNAITSRRLFQ